MLLYPEDVTPKRRYILRGGNVVIQSDNSSGLIKTISNCYKVIKISTEKCESKFLVNYMKVLSAEILSLTAW